MKTSKNLLFLCCFLAVSFLQAQNIYNDTYEFVVFDPSNEGAIEAAEDGGTYFAYNVQQKYPTEPSHYETSFVIAKTAPNGSLTWIRHYDATEEGEIAHILPVSIKKSPNEEALIHSGIMFDELGNAKFFLQKLNMQGVEQWFYTYDCPIIDGSSEQEECQSWVVDAMDINENGKIGVLGTLMETSGRQNAFVAYFTSDGNLEKTQYFGFDNEDTFGTGIMIKHSGSDFYVLTRSTTYAGVNIFSQPLISKLDDQMNVSWRVLYNHIDDEQHYLIEPTDMVINSKGHCIVLGTRNYEFMNTLNELYLLGIDANGQHLWDNTLFVKTADGDSGFYQSFLTIDGSDNLYIGFDQFIAYAADEGYSYANNPGMIKTNPGGAPQWYHTLLYENQSFTPDAIVFSTDANGGAVNMIGHTLDEYSLDYQIWMSRFSAANGENGCNGEAYKVYCKNLNYTSLGAVQFEKEITSSKSGYLSVMWIPNPTRERCFEPVEEE